jgi:tetratricopeptide (TPR) repeat protein
MRAHLRQLQSRGEDAADCYRRGLEREPSRHEQREKLAETLLFLRQYAEAERELRACLERRPGDLKLSAMLAECRFHQGAVDEAAATLTRLLESPGRHRGEPGADGAAALLGEVLLAAGKPAQAVEWLEELMPRRSWSAPDRYSLAMALQSSGRADEAAEHFRFVEQAENELAEMERQLVDVARQPQNAALRIGIARTLLKYGEPDNALRWAESAAALDPTSPECRDLVQAARRRWNDSQQQNARP